jgi:hypothetical protein
MPFVPELFKHINNNVFLETGTFQGDTLCEIIENCNLCNPRSIISLELSEVFFKSCVNRFKNNSNVTIYKANSKCDLYNIIKNIDSPITFWLDSHWSGVQDVGCDDETICPILEELEQIKQHDIKIHTIMIDDIRLMNASNIREHGFPVSLQQIIKKIYEINPNYKIKYYNDYICNNDVLVAYIEEKTCTHKYLTTCKTNPQPPGFADYLRGTITLFNLSQKYGYKLLLDNTHPLFKFLKENENIVTGDPSEEVIELLPPTSYEHIYIILNRIFENKESFMVMTNSFYTLNNGKILYTWGEISKECSEYLKNIFTPSLQLDNKIEYVIRSVYNIKNGERFKAIHIRTGDIFIHENVFCDVLYNDYYKKISNIVNQDKNYKYVLISDSSKIANKLKDNIEGLCYWDNKKIHLGDLYNNSDSALLDTMADFFILTKSSEIISNGSGFSAVACAIYNIKYTIF